MGARGDEVFSAHPLAPPRRHAWIGHFCEAAARGDETFCRARRGIRHYAHANVHQLERFSRLRKRAARAPRGGDGNDRESDLFRLAAPHGSVLRGTSPAGSGYSALSDLLQRRGRPSHPGAGANSHTGYPRECRRRAGRISWPLQQRLGTAMLLGGSETWHPNPAHRRAATR